MNRIQYFLTDCAVLAAVLIASGAVVIVGGLFTPNTLAHSIARFFFSVQS